MLSLKWKYGAAGISGTWDCPLPKGYAKLFREMCQIYFYSALKKSRVYMQGISDPMNALLAEFYNANGINVDSWDVLPLKEIQKAEHKIDTEKTTLMFTGGKDSLHALLYYLEKLDKSKIQCIYIPSINKSKSVYERETVKKICDKLGVLLHVVEVSNSVHFNRSGNNIGLRNQLLVTLALPYIVDFGSSIVVFGLHDAFHNISDPNLFTSHVSAFGYLTHRMQSSGIRLEIKPHPVDEISELEITKELIEKHSELFWMTNFCDRQSKFRERQNEKLRERHPGFKTYNGCGNCIECLKINGILSLYEYTGNKAARWNMAKEVNNTFIKIFPEDETLKKIVDELRGNILKTE